MALVENFAGQFSDAEDDNGEIASKSLGKKT